MKRTWFLIFACLFLSACSASQAQTPTASPDKVSTDTYAVLQTLTAQPPQPTVDIQATIRQGIAQTQEMEEIMNTAVAQSVAQTVQAAQAGQPPQPIQQPVADTPVPEENQPPATVPAPSSIEPQIVFVEVPPIGSSENVSGKVEGVNPDDYVVALYIRVGGGWWSKPTFAQPTCAIDSGGTWSCPYVSGGSDTEATVIRAYLIPIGYNPPALDGDSNVPPDLLQHAVAMAENIRR